MTPNLVRADQFTRGLAGEAEFLGPVGRCGAGSFLCFPGVRPLLGALFLGGVIGFLDPLLAGDTLVRRRNLVA